MFSGNILMQDHTEYIDSLGTYQDLQWGLKRGTHRNCFHEIGNFQVSKRTYRLTYKNFRGIFWPEPKCKHYGSTKLYKMLPLWPNGSDRPFRESAQSKII